MVGLRVTNRQFKMGTRSGRAFAAKGSQGSGSPQTASQNIQDVVSKNSAADATTNGSKKRRKVEIPDSTAESQSQAVTNDLEGVAQAQEQIVGEVVAETQDAEDEAHNRQSPDIAMVDEEYTAPEQAPPSSQPRPIDDEEDEGADSQSVSSFEGAYSYSDLNDDSSSGDESEADVDLELIEAEARRRLLAEDVGDEDDLSDTESEKEAASTVLKIPIEQAGKSNRMSTQAKAAAKPTKVPLTGSLSAEIETFARSHSVWKVAETAKEFNKILFPFLRQAKHLSQEDSLKVLTALREKWTAERSRSGQQKITEAKPVERRTKKSAVEKQQKSPGVRDESIIKKAKVTKKEGESEVGHTEVEEKPAGVGDSEGSTQKRKRRDTQEDANTQEHASITAEESRVVENPPLEHDVVSDVTSEPAAKSISKRAAKRQKREAKQAGADQQPAEKLQLVNSNDWYKNDKDEVIMIDAPGAEQVDNAVEPSAPEKNGPKASKTVSKGAAASANKAKKKKNGTKSNNQSSRKVDPRKAKVDRAQLIASLTKEMMEDVLGPQTATSEPANEEGDAKDREPVFFSSGGAAAVARVERPGVMGNKEDATSSKAVKGKSKTTYPPNLTKLQKRDLARELNKKKQLEQNKAKKAAKEAAAAKTESQMSTEHGAEKELAQTNSFQEMARKAREAVKAAQVVVEKTVAENDKLKKGARVEEVTASTAKDVSVVDSEGKKRKRKRNNNKLAEEEVAIGNTQQPLQPAAPNEQNPAGEPTQKSRRRPRAQKIAALLGQDVDAV